MRIKLSEIAHSRAGDKGNTLVLSLFPNQETDYSLLLEKVTTKALKAHFSGQILGQITRHEIPGLHALLFTCENALGSGVTTSLSLDAHGKSLSYALLQMEIEV